MIVATIALVATPLAPVPVEVTVDATVPSTPFEHKWKRSFGSGHAALGTRADWRDHLKQCVAELGLRGVRMHGLFDDDMSVMPAKGTYRWYNVDQLFDFPTIGRPPQ